MYYFINKYTVTLELQTNHVTSPRDSVNEYIYTG